MNEEDRQLLERLLFDPTMSRNRHFELFQQADKRSLHQEARFLRNLREQLEQPEVEHWTEESNEQRVCLRLHQPHLNATRTVFLTPLQWELLHHPDWKQETIS